MLQVGLAFQSKLLDIRQTATTDMMDKEVSAGTTCSETWEKLCSVIMVSFCTTNLVNYQLTVTLLYHVHCVIHTFLNCSNS
jgi:hypothetical protein